MSAPAEKRFKEYLGDSVYASFDGNGIVLTTENGLPTDPSNTIVLEPHVLDSLLNYRERLHAQVGLTV